MIIPTSVRYPPKIGINIKHHNAVETDAIIRAYQRVGRNPFLWSEVSDLLNSISAQKLRQEKYIFPFARYTNKHATQLKFCESLAYRIDISGVLA